MPEGTAQKGRGEVEQAHLCNGFQGSEPAGGLPHRPARPQATKLGTDFDFEVVREDDYGLFGLIARHIGVSKSTWDDHNAWCKQQAETGHPPRRSIFMVPVVPPYTPFAAVWSGFMTLVDLIYTAYWVPLGVAFCTEGFGNLAYKCTSADLLGGCIYTLNMLFGFQFGCIITYDYKKMEVRDGIRVALYYVKYGRFWLDVLAVIPFIYLLIIIGTPSLENDDRRFWIGILSLIRLVRLLRLVSVSKVVVMDAMSGKYHDITTKYLSVMQLYTLLLAYLLSVLINLEACIMLLIATLVGLENSFLTSVEWEDFTEVPEPYRWYTAIYWVITTSTTTGYGDFTPRNAAEQVFANIYMMIGMMMFGLMVGTIANALTRASAQAATLHSFRKKLSQVTKWLEDHKIPERTQKQVQTYFTEVWVNREETSLDSEIFSDLPSSLRAKVAQYVTTDLVLQMHVLRDQESGLQELIAQHLRPVDVTPGHDVCRQGEEGDRLWICAEGDLVAVQHQTEPQFLNTPCMFGESIILADSLPAFRLRPWTVRTMGVVRLWELKVTDLWPIMRMYPQFQEDFLEFVRSMLLTELGFTGAANQDDTWCESVVSISTALMKQSQAVADQAVLELRQANLEDGSLQELLDGLLEFSAIKTNRITLRTPLQVQLEQLEAEQQQQEYESLLQQQQRQQQQQQQQHSDGDGDVGAERSESPERAEAQSVPEHFPHHGWQQDGPAGRGSSESSQGIGRRGSQLVDDSALEQSSIRFDSCGGAGAVADGGVLSPVDPDTGAVSTSHPTEVAMPPSSQPTGPSHPPPPPPRRRRSWLHHGGFPPTEHEAMSAEGAPAADQVAPHQDSQLHGLGSGAGLQGQHIAGTLGMQHKPAPPHQQQQQALATNPLAPPSLQALVAAHSHPGPPPNMPIQTLTPTCTACGHARCPACGHGLPVQAPTATAASGLQGQHVGAPGGPGLLVHPGARYPLSPSGALGTPLWEPPHLPNDPLQAPIHPGHADYMGTCGGHFTAFPRLQYRDGLQLPPLAPPGAFYGNAEGRGSSLLPLLGVRGRGRRMGPSNVRTSPEVQLWQPEGRSSMPRGIRTMSLANRPGQSALGTSSIPVANFGEGYGIWG
ncbi:hypothetical protein DUNSADRAFT_5328 [Dunaliella salina]|uniref:Cyclic nucleotide-binding domain-containing protein n=1 Tax=Dunaliella salina TaxID=3046 RepID=A0ABQ7GQF3_DUNSA|nr:hypothetical protein DUNSADRAFT_5328 [Dunaliella salina]|eukprot:KAF5836837.1 hypothetical protein DUNSADRAFT_5328 [Dunaliella salina]